MQAIRLAAISSANQRIAVQMSERLGHYKSLLAEHRQFIQQYGKDPDDIAQWQWSEIGS